MPGLDRHARDAVGRERRSAIRAALARALPALVFALAPAVAAAQIAPQDASPTRPPAQGQPSGAPSTTAEPPRPAATPATPATPAAQSSPSATAATLTFDRALELATKQVTELTQAEQDVRVAEEDVRIATYGFYPVFSAPLQYIFTSPLRGPAFGGVPFTQRDPAFVANNGINEYVLLANAEGAIDVNGRLRATLDKSRADLAKARATELVARRGLTSAVSDAYYGLALARAKREIAETTLSSARGFLDTTKKLFAGGEVAELDTLKARVDETSREDELLQARSAEQEAIDTLNALVGATFGTPTSVPELTSALPLSSELDGYTADQISKRPELAVVDADEKSADADVRIARADRLPSLAYSVSAGVDDTRVVPSRDLGASAAVTVSVPIFDWGASRAKQRQAELRRESARRSRELVERALRQQFSTARVQAELAAERVRVLGAGVGDAARALDISVARYQAGEAPVLEVVDARSTLAAQRTAYAQAIFDYHVALDRLRAAVGK